MRYCPPIYVLCVSSHLWTVPRQIKFWAILIKSWDWRDPPPLVGTKSQVYPKKLLDGSPYLLNWLTVLDLQPSRPNLPDQPTRHTSHPPKLPTHPPDLTKPPTWPTHTSELACHPPTHITSQNRQITSLNPQITSPNPQITFHSCCELRALQTNL